MKSFNSPSFFWNERLIAPQKQVKDEDKDLYRDIEQKFFLKKLKQNESELFFNERPV